jgi:predicted MPP superfamily phosphohydrolase
LSTTNLPLEARERQRERRRSFITFFSIVFSIYGLINFYIFVRLNQSIPESCWFHSAFTPIFLFVALSYFVGQYLEHKSSSWLSDSLTWIGAIWLGTMTWFLLAAVIVDVVRLADYVIGFLPGAWYLDGERTKGTIATVGTLVIFISMTYGFWNARNIRVKKLSVKIDKARPGGPLRIAMISDMHMGTIVGRSMVEQMVAKINSIEPDLVLMAGDQIDGNPHPVMQLDLGTILQKIKSKYGIFAITGNHEHIGNAETSCAYLEAHGVKMIRDSHVEVAGLYIVGREDPAAKQFAHLERKPLSDLVAPLDRLKPIILMDHTPFHLEEAEQNGVDLQLSGHTHHAQIWPWSFITKKVYEVSWGYKKKGNTHVYVSCGAGTWGPPIRIGNRPEVMEIRLHFMS